MKKCSRFTPKARACARLVPLMLALAAGTLPATADPEVPAHAVPSGSGEVFTSTNSAFGNAVAMFHKATDGGLTPIGTYFTGGMGTGGGLGIAGAVTLSPDRRFLYSVDAASNDIAAFFIGTNRLYHLRNVNSGGKMPVSIATYGRLLYVLNIGGTDNITGFTINRNGSLTPLPGSTRSLSTVGTGAAQVEFSPDGEQLIVTERATNKIDVFPVGPDGVAGPALVTNSVGKTPFGFEFDSAGHLIVSEAFGGAPGAGAVSSYFVSDFGSLPITGSAQDGQAAPCWIAVSKKGTYAWTSNTNSGTLSAYDLAPNGRLSLLEGGGLVADTGSDSKPTDMALDAKGRYLYVLESAPGAVAAFRVETDGTLTALGAFGSLGPGATGLVTR